MKPFVPQHVPRSRFALLVVSGFDIAFGYSGNAPKFTTGPRILYPRGIYGRQPKSLNQYCTLVAHAPRRLGDRGRDEAVRILCPGPPVFGSAFQVSSVWRLVYSPFADSPLPQGAAPRDPIRWRIQVAIQSVTSPAELPFSASFSAAASTHTWWCRDASASVSGSTADRGCCSGIQILATQRLVKRQLRRKRSGQHSLPYDVDRYTCHIIRA